MSRELTACCKLRRLEPKMSQAGVSRVMVVEQDRLVGLLSLSDLMKFIALKVELEDGDDTNSDTLPQLQRNDGTGRSFEENEIVRNERIAETR